MRFSRILLAALVLAALGVCQRVEAAAAAGRVAAPYLKLPMSTRATGMGEAFTGLAEDDAALYYNPGGIAQTDSTVASFMHLQGFGGINYEYLGMVTAMENLGIDVWGSIGLSYTLIGIGDIPRTRADAFGNYDQAYADRNFTFNAAGTVVGLAYAWQATKLFSLGGELKMINQKVDTKDGWGFAGDLGLFTKPDMMPGFSAGLAVQNVGSSPDSTAGLPINLRVGVAYDWKGVFSKPELKVDNWIFTGDINLPIAPTDAATRFSVGMEYGRWFAGKHHAALRTGYRFPTDLGPMAGLTAGVGYAIEVPQTLLSLDYAFVPYGDLGMSHRISLTGNFGLRKPKSPYEAVEEFGTPKGLQGTGGDRRAALSWQPVKAKNVKYNVYMTYNPTSGRWYKLNRQPLSGVAQNIGSLYNGVTTYFSVTAVQLTPTARESAKSQPIVVVPRPAGTMSTPVLPQLPQAKPAAPAAKPGLPGPPPLP